MIGTAALLFLKFSCLFAQPLSINAGSNQIINWEKTKSVHLAGSVVPNNVVVKWSCPQNSEVNFKDASRPITEVTFPRPGYYVLILSYNDSASSSVVVNVFQPHSYKERLADLIKLMTVDEKIKQLTNETDPIPRPGIPK